MQSIEIKLRQYAAYHQDRRNVATHFVGIPLIVVALMTLLSRPSIEMASVSISPATFLYITSGIYYLVLDRPLGVVMAILHGGAIIAGTFIAAAPTSVWLSWGLGLFVTGWALQFIGHLLEGRKPAFVDDLIGLLIGPLFVVVEAALILGLRHDLRRAIHPQIN
jgi:uncharacterized membrane protein YGL010W